MGRSRIVAGMVSLGICLGVPGSAGAERGLTIAVSGECPTREAVIAALQAALPSVTVTEDPGPVVRIVVTDDGASYRIEVDGTTRTFDDASADCDERARKVAVITALAVEPPAIDVGAMRMYAAAIAARAPRQIAPAIEVARDEPAARVAVQIETGGVVEHAPGHDGELRSAGVDLRLAVGRARGAIVVGGAMVTPLSVDILGGHARVRRVPLDVAVRNRLRAGALTAAIEVGPRFTIQHSEGVDVIHSESAIRLEVGARLAARFEVWPSWSLGGAYVLFQTEYVPRPSRFTLPDQGVVGEMPSLWIGASLGLAIRTL